MFFLQKFIFLSMFLAGCLFCQDLIGQTILLERNVSVDTITPNFGRNRKHYFKYFVGFGFAAGSLQNPTKAGIKIKHGSSFELRLGFYYKRRINHNFSFGATSDFLYARNILTAPMFPILSGYEGKKYYYSGGSLSLAPYFRINFDNFSSENSSVNFSFSTSRNPCRKTRAYPRPRRRNARSIHLGQCLAHFTRSARAGG